MNSNLEFYEAFADDYEHYYAAVDASATVKQWLALMETERLVPSIEKRRLQAPHLLDLGCGPGWHLPAWRAECFRVAGLDASPAMLRLAARLGAGFGSDIPLYCADVCDELSLQPLANTFDFVVSHFNFLNLFSPLELKAIFNGVARLLRSDGYWLTDIVTASPANRNGSSLESIDGWQRESIPSAETVTVRWKRAEIVLVERYWFHQSSSIKAAAAATGLCLHLTRSWNPEHIANVWRHEETKSPRLLLVFSKSPCSSSNSKVT
jgi:SAM-dependent methyltransferase